MSLAKEVAIFVSAFFPILPNQEPKDPPNWIILDIRALVYSVSVDILLAEAFLILAVCLVVRNDSYRSYLSSKLFLFNLNIVLVLFFAAAFNLFSCIFVRLTLVSC